MGRSMMGHNIYNIMSNRGMPSDMSNMLGQQMNSNMRDHDMAKDMMVQDRSSQMIGGNIMGYLDMTPNMMYSNMMGQDMMDVTNRNQMSSNLMNTNNGRRMMQQMEVEHVPETYTSTRFF